MGPWISIILSILEALPTVIKIIQDVVVLVHGHPNQAEHEHAFHGLLLDWQKGGGSLSLVKGLQDLRDKLRGAS